MKKRFSDIQLIINEKIRENLSVYADEMTQRQALDKGATALFGEKYGETVRVLQVGHPPVSMELCGGTHVTATGEIGYFRIVSESSVGTGIRRIEAVTGRAAERFINDRFNGINKLVQILGTRPEELEEKITSLLAGMDEQKKKLAGFERDSSRQKVDALLAGVEQVKGIKVLAAEVAASRPEALREMGDILRDRLQSGVIVLAAVFDDKPSFLAIVTPDLVTKGYHAGKLIKSVAAVAGGGGGGRPEMAQAGGKDKTKIREALAMVKTLV